MIIKKVISQHRRDMQVEWVCEHCGWERTGSAYDDANYHERVIPKMECCECGKKTNVETYVPRDTKYPEGLQI